MPPHRTFFSPGFLHVSLATIGLAALGGCSGSTETGPTTSGAATPGATPAAAPEAAPGAPRADGPPPNILFILVDTLRADALGVYGQTRPTSPRIDAFAETAVVYERAWTQYTWTSPSYVSYMTSRYARTHGWDYRLNKPDTFRALDERAPMLAQVLSGKGYATSAQFSQPNLRPDLAFNRGFDVFTKGAEKGAVGGAIASIGKWKDDDKPNFTYVHLMVPHVPLLPTDEARKAVGAPLLGKQISYDWWVGAPADQKAQRLEEFRLTYHACVRDADTSVGRILDALDATGLADETVVVLTSDHGELIGEHEKIGHTETTAEALTHVPLLVRIPGVAPRRERAPASLIDIAPTLAAVAGAPAPAEWQGRSLLAGGTAPLIAERDNVLSISDGTWKVTEDRASGSFLSAYDLSKDPGERTALGAEASPAIPELAAAAKAWRERLPDLENGGAAPVLDADEQAKRLEELRTLGYIE